MRRHYVKREPRNLIVPGGHPVNVPMSPVSRTRLVGDYGIGGQGVAALPLGTVMALFQAPLILPLDPKSVFAKLE